MVGDGARNTAARPERKEGKFLMAQHISASTPRLYSASDTNFEADIVATDRVTVSLTGRNYDTLGYHRRSNAVADLTVAQARRLAGLLNEAIATAAAEPLDTRQTAIWSDATVADVARRIRA
jgi:hypothetical protein